MNPQEYQQWKAKDLKFQRSLLLDRDLFDVAWSSSLLSGVGLYHILQYINLEGLVGLGSAGTSILVGGNLANYMNRITLNAPNLYVGHEGVIVGATLAAMLTIMPDAYDSASLNKGSTTYEELSIPKQHKITNVAPLTP